MRYFRFLSRNVLLVLTIVLLIFIPLYPKIPLLGVKHTWVYIRIEDFLVAFSLLVWLVLLIKRKVSLKTPLTLPIVLFWVAGAVATSNALFLLAPKPIDFHLNVAFLTYLRHIEYLSVFFIGFFAMREKRFLKPVVIALVLTLVGVVLYGLGQRFLGLPAFLTMNEEFAKGIPLRLSAAARIPSTFAGHYDLAAYLVMLIPLLGSLIFGVKNVLAKIALFLASFSALVLLLMTASRTSFLVYLFAVTLMLFLQKQKRFILPVLVLSILLLQSFQGLSSRFKSTISSADIVYDARTGKPVGIAKEKNKKIIVENTQPTGENLPQGTGYINLPTNQKPQQTSQILYKKTRLKSGTVSAETTNLTGDFVVKRGFAYDVSFTTRLQGEWPRALEAFNRNLLLGSGYSSIGLATDGNYFRMLGETGVLGFVSFALIFIFLGVYIYKTLPSVDSPFARSYVLGVVAAIFALFVNAFLIDVFEASKVAFVTWLLIGVCLGVLKLYQKINFSLLSEVKKVLLSAPALSIYLIVIAFAAFSLLAKNYFVGDDFTWLRWAADCQRLNVSSQCASLRSTLEGYFLTSNGFFYRPLMKVYFYFLYALFSLNPIFYHYLSIFWHALSVVAVFLLAKKLLNEKFAAFLTALMFAVLSSHYEAIGWISAGGHILSAALILWGLVFYLYFQETRNYFLLFLAWVSLLIAPFFQEMGVVGPLLVVMYMFFTLYPKSSVRKRGDEWHQTRSELSQHSKNNVGTGFTEKFSFKKIAGFFLPALFLLQIPFYLILRINAKSIWFTGDYSYNLLKLPFNILGNSFGYLGFALFGYPFMSSYTYLRDFGRGHLFLFMLLGVFVFGLLFLLMRFVLRISLKSRQVFLFTVCFFLLSLLPVLGLGNIAGRYDYLGSVAVLLLMVFLLQNFAKSLFGKRKYLPTVFVIVLVSVFSFYHVLETKRLNKDWHQAGTITSNMLADFTNAYSGANTLPAKPVFYFVNVPIKKGEAWVFPTGLPDALWFAFQNEDLKVVLKPSLKDAFLAAENNKNASVFMFDENGSLQQVNK